MVSAIDPIAVVTNPPRRNGFSTNSSLASPTRPAATNAHPSEGSSENPNRTLATNPANAPIVACDATAKLGNRSTAYIAVRPIAGTASAAPAISPFSTSCASSMLLLDRYEFEFASLDDLKPELAALDIADRGEVTRAADAFVIDLLAGGQLLQAVCGRVDLDAVTLRDPSHGVAQRGAGGRSRLGDCQRDEADPVDCLGFIRVRIAAQARFRHGKGRRINIGGRLRGVGLVGHIGRQCVQHLLGYRVGLGEAGSVESGLVKFAQQHRGVGCIAVKVDEVGLHTQRLIDLRPIAGLVLFVCQRPGKGRAVLGQYVLDP